MNLFFNPAEQRARMGWRLIAFTLISILLFFVFTFVFGFAAVFLNSALREQVTASPGQAVPDVSAFVLPSVLAGLLSVVGAVWLCKEFVDRRQWVDYGLRFSGAWFADLLVGLVLGAALMGGIFLVERALGWVTVTGAYTAPAGTTFAGAFLVQVIVYLCVGVYEELLFRGYLLPNIAEGVTGFGLRGAVLFSWAVTSVVFGLLHGGNPNATWVSTVNLIAAGFFLGVGFVLTGRLALPIGLHITWNLFQGNVFGFPVSGLAPATSVIAIDQGGPTLWTGGAFGPEAGLIGLAAMLVGTALIYGYAALRKETGVNTALAVWTPDDDKPRNEGTALG